VKQFKQEKPHLLVEGKNRESECEKRDDLVEKK